MQPIDHLCGEWRKGDVVRQTDAHTPLTYANWQTVQYIASGIGASVNSYKGYLLLNVSRPGMHALYYAIHQGRVFWDEYKWPLIAKLKSLGASSRVTRVEAGTLVIIDGKAANVRNVQPERTVVSRSGISLADASDELHDIFLRVAREIYEMAGAPRVTTLLSGGTDSTLGAIMLREIGADQHCICVGVSEKNFDPKFAKNYAEQLDLPYTQLFVDPDPSALEDLAYRTLSASEYPEMSNTLMGMCTTMIREWAIENDRPLMWHGHFADDTLGNNPATQGGFRKRHEVTDQNWSDFRAAMYQHIIPNNMQVANVSRHGGQTFWRSMFYHPDVTEFVWSMPLEHVPLTMTKPLYEAICERYLTNPSWKVGRKQKMGYYSGSGMGKLRTDTPVLSDQSFRAIAKTAKANITGISNDDD